MPACLSHCDTTNLKRYKQTFYYATMYRQKYYILKLHAIVTDAHVIRLQTNTHPAKIQYT